MLFYDQYTKAYVNASEDTIEESVKKLRGILKEEDGGKDYNQIMIECLADELKRHKYQFDSCYNKKCNIWCANVSKPHACKIVYYINKHEISIEYSRDIIITCHSFDDVISTLKDRSAGF